MLPYVVELPELEGHEIWVLPAESIKEHIPHGDWIMSQDDVDLPPADRVLKFCENVLARNVKSYNTVFTRRHEDGWTITGEMHNDWYSWVEDFEASHETYGKIIREGNKVYGENKRAYNNFIKHHPFEVFDGDDI